MREWDELVARQVSAAGVRTTWGEHVAPPGGEVMGASPILSEADFKRALLDVGYGNGATANAGEDVLNAHDAALRAALAAAEQRIADTARGGQIRLAAAEERAANREQEVAAVTLRAMRAEERAAEAEREMVWFRERGAAVEAERNAAEAERDQAIRERDDALQALRHPELLRALADNRTLREALTEAQRMLHEDGANAAGEVKAILDAALGEKPMKHSDLPKHCSTCGIDWPEGANAICPSCGAGLCCRADTTDTVAPDPPCAGSRLRLKEKNDGT